MRPLSEILRSLNKSSSVELQEDVPMWRRPISSTVGRIHSPIYAAIMGSMAPLSPGPTAEDMEILKQFEHHLDDDYPLKAYPNRTPLLPVIRDIYKNPRIGPAEKTLGILSQPLLSALANLTRADHYNPLSNSIHSYINHPAIKAHEIGHAIDFDAANKKGNNPFLSRLTYGFYPMTLFREGRASTNASRLLEEMDHPEKDKILDDSSRMLSAAYGTYVGSPLGPIGSAAGAAGGQVIGVATRKGGGPFTGDLIDPSHVKPGRGLLQALLTGGLSGAALGAMVGVSPELAREAGAPIKQSDTEKYVTVGAGIGAVSGSIASILHRMRYNKKYGEVTPPTETTNE